MLRVATTVIVAALMAASLASAALANHPGHGGGGGQTTLSDLGCGPDKIARVNAADEWECNADLTANEAAAVAAQAAADAAQTTATAAGNDAAAAQSDADAAQTTATAAGNDADAAQAAADAAQTTATAAGDDAAAAQATLGGLDDRISALEELLVPPGEGVPGAKRAFVTSGAYAPTLMTPDCTIPGADPNCVPSDGVFNSVTQADALCQGAAMSAGLTVGGFPLYLAWLSTAVRRDMSFPTSPSGRFVFSDFPYISTNPSGTVIANNWDDLTDGILNFSILFDEFGNRRDDIGVWTGTHDDGSARGCDCDSWSPDPGPQEPCEFFFPFDPIGGSIGDSTVTNFEWTDILQVSSCNEPHALYCFEQ